jgi:uncharacterized repeat protein (TIGR01451 family)
MKTCCLRSFLFTCAWLACAALLPTTSLAWNWPNAAAIDTPMTFESAPVRDFSSVRFLARGNGYRLYLGQSDFEVALMSPGTHGGRSGNSSVQTVRLHASISGASGQTRPEPLRPSPGIVNSFRGSDPAGWSEGSPTFEQIRYREIYPGIDLVFYGNQQSLEYDFIVSPGANPEQIRLAFEGVTGADLENGDLVLHCGAGDFRHHRPIIYQVKNGCRVAVPGEYTLHNDAAVQVSFKIGSYDRNQPLWIDPVLDYGTFLGGSGNDSGQGVAVDSNGNIYVTGQTVSTDFPTTVGAYDSKCGTDGLCNGGHYDVFVTKIDATGTNKVYSTYFGGSDDEQAWGIAVDSAGRAHIMGWTASTNFPTLNPFQSALAGGRDAFVSSFDANGQLTYSTYFGGSSDMDADIAGGIALDSQGKVYITARTASPDFPVRNAFQNPGNGLRAFLAKFDPLLSGNASLLYSTCLGGNADSGGTGIAVDSFGMAYISGYTAATDFPVTNAAQPVFGGVRDSFAAKFDPTKSGAASLLFATYLGGSGEEAETSGGIAVDNLGQAWVTGATRSTNFPVHNSLQAYAGDWDVYVAKLSTSGSNILFATYLGGSGADAQLEAHVAVDPSGNAYLTGHTLSSDFPVTQGAQPASSVDSVYIAKINSAGTKLSYSLVPGPGEGRAIAVDSAQHVYVTGQTSSSSFPTQNPLQSALNGPSDAFVIRLRPSVNDVAIQVTPSLNTVSVGSNLVCIVTATNRGPDPASVLVTNLVSGGLSFLNFPADCSYFGSEVDSPVLQLQANAARTILLVVKPTTVGSVTFHANLWPDDGDTNAGNNSATATVSVVASAPPFTNALSLRNWDYAAVKWNTGEIMDDTQIGVLGSPMGTLGGAVNLMVTNRSKSIFLSQGPSGDSFAAFGFLNATNWVPTTRDGTDLTIVNADRIFATVNGFGDVLLISAAAFTPGIILATNHINLSPNSAFRLAIDPVQDLVRLFYAGSVVAQGNPFSGTNAATRALVGNDFAVSIFGGTGDLGYSIINDRPLTSLVHVSSLRPVAGNQLQMIFQDGGNGAVTYGVAASGSLAGPWTQIAGVTITSLGGGVYQANFPKPAATAYYRVIMTF